MGNVPNLIDIDFYCDELSKITGLNVQAVKLIVLINFSKVYDSNGKKLDFTDATAGIENDITTALKNKQSKKRLIQFS